MLRETYTDGTPMTEEDQTIYYWLTLVSGVSLSILLVFIGMLIGLAA